MKKPLRCLTLPVVILLALQGCSYAPYITEPMKRIWGTSMMRLEKKRQEALKATYACSFDECYDAVLSLGRGKEFDELIEPYYYHSLAVEPEGTTTPYRGIVPDVPQAILPETQETVSTDKTSKPGQIFDVFHKSRTKGYIVFMGTPGSVDTTEVGVFFTRSRQDEIIIEIASLSTSAKNKAAEIVFAKLDRNFRKVE